ncbi:SCAPE-like protein, partial [Mya arenaria]
MSTSDHVKRIVQEEGRTARNLVIYHVPVQENQAHDRSRPRHVRKPLHKDQSDLKASQKSDLTKSPKSDGGKKPDLRARYWKFLFDNLQRAVDAIYETCEQDESALECKEVIMMLQQSTKDFQSLIERLHVQKEYEQATKDGDRPTSIAWEVRKMSPGKSPSGLGHRTSPSPAQRVLNFSYPDQGRGQKQGSTPVGNSWADRVKGTVTSPAPSTGSDVTPDKGDHPVLPEPPILSPVPSSLTESDSYREINESEDSDGWEMVQRKVKPYGSPSQRSMENLSTITKIEHQKLTRSVSEPYTAGQALQKKLAHTKGSPKESKLVNGRTARKSPVKKDSLVNGEKKDTVVNDKPVVVNGDVSVNSEGQKDSSDKSKDSAVSVDKKTDLKKPEAVINRSQGMTRKSTDSIRKSGSDSSITDTGKKPSAGDSKAVTKTKPMSGKKTPTQKTDTSKSVKKSGRKSPVPKGSDKDIGSGKKSPKSNSLENIKETDDKSAVVEPVVENEMEIKVEMSTYSDDESERKLDDAETSLTDELAKEQAIETAIAEEETWLKELAKEENTVIDVETETESDLGNTMSSLDLSTPGNLDWDAMVAEYDAEEKAGVKKNWGEMAEEDTRTPGYAAKAQELRDKFMQEKAERLRVIGAKVEEVRALKEELMKQKRDMIERKMAQAEEKRQIMLNLEAQNKRLDIMSKHQESEARLQDLMDERQRKHEEKLAKEAAVEERRRALQADRLTRLQEIKERRKTKDARVEQQMAERETERIEALRAKEKDREERLATLSKQHEAQKQELQKKIQQKQEGSSARHMEALKHIREKAFEMSILRHSTEDHNDAPQITPYPVKKMCTICNTLILSEVYLLSHLRGKTHQQALKHNNNGMSMTKQEIESFNLAHIVNAPDNNTHPKIVSEKERIKAQKKRCKKLKQRMNSRGLEYENTVQGKSPLVDSENKAKIQKNIRDINKYLQSPDSGPWSQPRVSALDRALGELNRIFEKKIVGDQNSFRHLGGLTSLCRIIQLVDTSNIQATPPIPQKSLVLTCQVLRQAVKGHYDNCHYMMFSNKIGLVIEFTIHQLTLMLPGESVTPTTQNPLMPEPPTLPYNLLGLSLQQLLTVILNCLAKNSPNTKSSEASLVRMSNTTDAFTSRGNDIISFIISVGIVDKLTQYLRLVQGPIDNNKDAAEFIQHSLGLLVSLTKFLTVRKSSIFEKKKLDDPTHLISTFEVTELVGIVSLLYGMLLHSGTPGRGDSAPPEFPAHTLAVAITGIRMLNFMATLDLDMMQMTLGQEGTSLEFRHISSYLIWYCSHHNAEELLHEVILCVGYFTIRNTDNQIVIQSGQPPTVLQQMCALPFQYFSDPRLVNILFPTLISCCYNNTANKEILEQELSGSLLANFLEEKMLETQQASAAPSPACKKSEKEKHDIREGEQRTVLVNRFPQEQWTAAQEYFKNFTFNPQRLFQLMYCIVCTKTKPRVQMFPLKQSLALGIFQLLNRSPRFKTIQYISIQSRKCVYVRSRLVFLDYL